MDALDEKYPQPILDAFQSTVEDWITSRGATSATIMMQPFSELHARCSIDHPALEGAYTTVELYSHLFRLAYDLVPRVDPFTGKPI